MLLSALASPRMVVAAPMLRSLSQIHGRSRDPAYPAMAAWSVGPCLSPDSCHPPGLCRHFSFQSIYSRSGSQITTTVSRGLYLLVWYTGLPACHINRTMSDGPRPDLQISAPGAPSRLHFPLGHPHLLPAPPVATSVRHRTHPSPHSDHCVIPRSPTSSATQLLSTT